MTHVLLLCVLAMASAVAAARQTPQPSETRTRDLHVAVVDQSAKPVADLTAEDFVVREDGAPREVIRVGPSTAPLSISVLVDDSQAAQPAIQQLREGLIAFVTGLPDTAEVALATFGERPTSVIEHTTADEQLKRGINRIFSRSGAGSYMLDAIAEISRGIQKRYPARPVIVVLTTEGVEFSNMRHEAVLKELEESGAVLHVLAIGSPSIGQDDESRSRQIVMAEGTRLTGGRRDQLLSEMAIPEKLKLLAEELKNWQQYQVTYGRPDRLVPPKMVEVSIKRAGLRALPPKRAAR
jgi:VWFA-related protein